MNYCIGMAFAGTIGRTATGQLENSNAQRRRRILTRFQFHNLHSVQIAAVHTAAPKDVSVHKILAMLSTTEPIFFTAPRLKIGWRNIKGHYLSCTCVLCCGYICCCCENLARNCSLIPAANSNLLSFQF